MRVQDQIGQMKFSNRELVQYVIQKAQEKISTEIQKLEESYDKRIVASNCIPIDPSPKAKSLMKLMVKDYEINMKKVFVFSYNSLSNFEIGICEEEPGMRCVYRYKPKKEEIPEYVRQAFNAHHKNQRSSSVYRNLYYSLDRDGKDKVKRLVVEAMMLAMKNGEQNVMEAMDSIVDRIVNLQINLTDSI